MKATVPAALAGERLDRVVAMLANTSRAEAANLVDGGSVTVSGRVVTVRSRRLNAGEVVEFDRPESDRAALTGDPGVPVSVVYENRDLIVVDKPAGIVVHPGAGQAHGTLVEGLLARYPELDSVGDPERPGIVHRLDKGTSGLLLVARSERAYERLVAMLSAHEIERSYRALVWGTVEAATGMVDAPLGRSVRYRTRMTVTMRGRPALTRYDVHRRFQHPVPATELVCTPVTGRTHQIRVHLASIGHPVVGDDRYGGARPGLQLGRPWLHAESLALKHPVTGEPLSFESPLPDELTAILNRLS